MPPGAAPAHTVLPRRPTVPARRETRCVREFPQRSLIIAFHPVEVETQRMVSFCQVRLQTERFLGLRFRFCLPRFGSLVKMKDLGASLREPGVCERKPRVERHGPGIELFGNFEIPQQSVRVCLQLPRA